MIKTVHVSVSNVYSEATYKSEMTSQALLGENVEVIKTKNDFDLVKQSDGYQGWIKNNQLSNFNENNFPKKTVIDHTVRIYQEMDQNSMAIRDVVIGCNLSVVEMHQKWFQIILPDNTKGYVQKSHFGKFPKLSRTTVVQVANQFLGYPYFWGGRSPRGFDCSGFTQTVFALLGEQIPRDSYMQRDALKEISKDIEDAEKGDILFFGDKKTKVDHVGIALGKNKIIHSRGMVKINSLNPSDADYDQKLDSTLICVSTVF